MMTDKKKNEFIETNKNSIAERLYEKCKKEGYESKGGNTNCHLCEIEITFFTIFICKYNRTSLYFLCDNCAINYTYREFVDRKEYMKAYYLKLEKDEKNE